MKIKEFSENHSRVMDALRFGVEIEAECERDVDDVSFSDLPPGWTTHHDPSLRNGTEFVSRPISPSYIERRIYSIYEFMRQWDYRGSPRTGIHVHVNCIGQTVETVGALCVTYALLEPILASWLGEDREENIYCVPWYRAQTDLKRIRDFIHDEQWRRLRETCKYAAIYMAPLTSYGTVEFRMAPTWDAPLTTIQWISILQRIAEYSFIRIKEQVLADYERLGGEGWLRYLFGSDLADRLLDAVDGYPDEVIEDTGALDIAEYLVGEEVPPITALALDRELPPIGTQPTPVLHQRRRGTVQPISPNPATQGEDDSERVSVWRQSMDELMGDILNDNAR